MSPAVDSPSHARKSIDLSILLKLLCNVLSNTDIPYCNHCSPCKSGNHLDGLIDLKKFRFVQSEFKFLASNYSQASHFPLLGENPSLFMSLSRRFFQNPAFGLKFPLWSKTRMRDLIIVNVTHFDVALAPNIYHKTQCTLEFEWKSIEDLKITNCVGRSFAWLMLISRHLKNAMQSQYM